MKEVITIVVGILLVVSIALGALLFYGRVQYEFRYEFDTVTLGTRSADIVRVLGKPEGKAQNPTLNPSQDARDSYTNTVTYQAESYLFWRQGSFTYYVGFDSDDTATMTVVRDGDGNDHICQVKGRERNINGICNSNSARP
jgi:hypothetical protein